MATELQRCPACKKELIDELHKHFLKNHEDAYFDFQCPKCKIEFEVLFESIPPFLCSLPEKKKKYVGVGLLL